MDESELRLQADHVETDCQCRSLDSSRYVGSGTFSWNSKLAIKRSLNIDVDVGQRF